MKKNQEIALSGAIVIGIFFHFYVGYFKWDIMKPAYQEVGKDADTAYDFLYGLSVYFFFDVMGLALYVISSAAKLDILRWLGAGLMVASTVYFYNEFNDPLYWTIKDYKESATLGLSLINLFMLLFFTDMFRNLKK